MDKFLADFRELLEKYPNMEVLLHVVTDEGEHTIAGNGCPACNASEIMTMLPTGRLKHIGDNLEVGQKKHSLTNLN